MFAIYGFKTREIAGERDAPQGGCTGTKALRRERGGKERAGGGDGRPRRSLKLAPPNRLRGAGLFPRSAYASRTKRGKGGS